VSTHATGVISLRLDSWTRLLGQCCSCCCYLNVTRSRLECNTGDDMWTFSVDVNQTCPWS
jgi:hypothetical protein